MTENVLSPYTIIQHDDTLLALNWALSQREDILFAQKGFGEDFGLLSFT